MTRRRVERVLLVAGALAAVAIEAFVPDLFTSLASATGALLLLYVLVRPTLLLRALRWLRAGGRRAAIVAIAALAALALVAFAGDAVRHPTVDEVTEAAMWNDANAALNAVAAEYLRWQNVADDARPAAAAKVREQAVRFAKAVDVLVRVRPPEAGRATYRSVAAVYQDMADTLLALPDALVVSDTDSAAAIWQRLSLLADEAASFAQLAAPEPKTGD